MSRCGRAFAPSAVSFRWPLPTEYPYPKGYFQFYDYDLPGPLVKHLDASERGGTTAWGRVLEAILLSAPELWADFTQAKLYRFHNSKTPRPVTTEPIAAWVHRLRSLRCLPDGYGAYREPAELYLRTPETEPLIGVEPFVRAELDTEATKPLLRLLGVRDTPAGADKLIVRVRAWTHTSSTASSAAGRPARAASMVGPHPFVGEGLHALGQFRRQWPGDDPTDPDGRERRCQPPGPQRGDERAEVGVGQPLNRVHGSLR